MARKTAAKKNPKIKTPKTPSVDVVVTTYEQLLLEDSANALGAISWSLLVVDEAHRLKNPHSRLYRTLHGDNGTFKAISRLLLTGTPLQNNMTELWSLLSFCDDQRFGDDPDEFVEKYACVSCVVIPWLLYFLVSGPFGPRRWRRVGGVAGGRASTRVGRRVTYAIAAIPGRDTYKTQVLRPRGPGRRVSRPGEGRRRRGRRERPFFVVG
jgi:hypothetical protein